MIPVGPSPRAWLPVSERLPPREFHPSADVVPASGRVFLRTPCCMSIALLFDFPAVRGVETKFTVH